MRAWLCLMLLPGLATAEIYRWVDDQGQVHFGQRPAGAGAEQVEVRPQVVERDQATRERLERSERFYDARRQEQAEAVAASAQRRAERDAQCRELRQRLAQLPQGRRYFQQEADGERTYYSDEQVDAARAQLRERIAQGCS